LERLLASQRESGRDGTRATASQSRSELMGAVVCGSARPLKGGTADGGGSSEPTAALGAGSGALRLQLGSTAAEAARATGRGTGTGGRAGADTANGPPADGAAGSGDVPGAGLLRLTRSFTVGCIAQTNMSVRVADMVLNSFLMPYKSDFVSIGSMCRQDCNSM